MTEESQRQEVDFEIDTDNVEEFYDTVSYYIYSTENEDAWIRSTVTIKQTNDNGKEKLFLSKWVNDTN